jgi:hypothetical protein
MLKSWFIHMDNARPRNSGQAQRCIEASRAEHLSHPAYGLGLAQGTSLFLDISKENYLTTIVRAGRND